MKTEVYKDLFTNNHSIFIHNSPKLNTTQMSFSRRMDKQRTTNTSNMGEIKKQYWVKNTNTKDNFYGEINQNNGCQAGVDWKEAQRKFGDDENGHILLGMWII